MAAYYAAAVHSLSRPFKVAYPAQRRRSLWADMRAHWSKITVAAAIGVFAGFVTGVISSRSALVFNQAVYAASPAPIDLNLLKPAAPTASNQLARDELTRLRLQNEHLESELAQLTEPSTPAHTRKARAHRRKHFRAHA